MLREHKKMKYIYIGIDCHKHKHTACVKNCFNEQLDILTFNNDKIGYNSLIDMVDKHTTDGLIPIYGLEDTKHLGYGLASFLLSKNCTVKNVSSNLTYVERKRNAVISKNDDLDSSYIAKILLDELDNLQNAESNEIYWTLKQVVKMRKSIVKSNIQYKNKLHSQLLHHYPNYNTIFSQIDGITALELWEQYPSPNMILDSTIDELTIFINNSSNGKLGTKKATQIYNIVKEYDIENTIYQSERNIIIKMLVKQIKENNKRLLEIDQEIISIYDKIEAKIHTMPCIDKIGSAYILAEIGNISRFQNSSKLAKYAGIAPIDCSSGDKDKSIKNEYGNRDLNTLIYNIACRGLSTGKNKKTPYNSIFLEYYHKKCNSGKTSHQAIICIMRRIINIIYHILKNDVEYKTPNELVEQCRTSFNVRKQQELEKQLLKEQKRLKYTNIKRKDRTCV